MRAFQRWLPRDQERFGAQTGERHRAFVCRTICPFRVGTLETLLLWLQLKYRHSWGYNIKFRNAGSASRTILSSPREEFPLRVLTAN